MKSRILTLGISILSIVTVFAANSIEDIKKDLALFKDDSCTTLAAGVKDTSRFRSDAMKGVAEKILAGNFNPEYLVAEYEAYPAPTVTGWALKIGDGFSKYESMTGVYLEKGEHVVIVGKTDGRQIYLLLPNWMRKPAEGVEPTKDPNGWGLHKQMIPLKEGVNIVQVDHSTNAYISYFADDYEKAPKLNVAFVTGKANGYFDTTRGDDNKKWAELIDGSVSPILDARGKYIQVAYPVEFLKKFTKGQGVELIEAYDKLIAIQYELMGLFKYNKVPKNRVLSRVNFNYYMFRDGDGVAYLGDDGTMRMVADPANVIKGDPCWGFSHEVGHVMQMKPMTWGGMTEVSNNIFSLQATTTLGTESRLKQQNNYESARKNIIEKQIPYLRAKDVFDRLVPLWQLHLYFTKNGCPDFYPDVMEYLRNNTENYTGNDTIKYQFDFIKACCEASKTDLTEFFEKWGFLKPDKITLDDYGRYKFDITQEMVDETKQWISSKNYPKPKDDITLTAE